MQIKASDEYKDDLFLLWKEAFGDEDGYISLFFNSIYKKNTRIFASLDNGKIVSALYLIPSYISADGKAYEGFYLYAAATLKSHRGRGIMETLINEAKNYASENGKAFISLVPGEEYLYSYYKKFGFEPVMYRGKSIINSTNDNAKADGYQISFDTYFNERDKKISVPSHHLCAEAYGYARLCYEYLGLRSFSTDNIAVIYDAENKCIKELLSENDDALIKSVLSKGDYIAYSPYGNEKEPFGMVWFADENIKIKDIYMNIALD